MINFLSLKMKPALFGIQIALFVLSCFVSHVTLSGSDDAGPSGSAAGSSESNGGFTDEQVAEYKKMFDEFDMNGDGKLTSTELVAAMNTLKKELPQSELADTMLRAIGESDGLMDFDGFLLVIGEILKWATAESERIGAAFRFFDKDGDGFISSSDLRQGMANLGETLTEQELNDMMLVADTDGDSRVSYKEFIAAVMAKLF